MNITSGIVASAQKIVIYGPEGIGKSTLASMFPDPLFSDTEGSTKRLNVKRFDRPTTEEMLIQQIEYVKAHPDICSTYVIDTADWAEKLCSQSVCAKYKKSGIEEFGYGKGYVYLNEEFGKILNYLEDVVACGINVVVTAHAIMRKFEQPDERGAFDRWELKLDKRNAPILKEWADAVFFANYKTIVEKVDDKKYKAADGGKRVMYTQHHSCWDAKNRYGLPPETDFDYSVIAPFVTSSGNTVQTAPNPITPSPVVEVPKTQSNPVQSSPMAELDNIIDNEPTKTVSQAVSDVPEGIPKELADLMAANDVTEEDIQLVVYQRGHFPIDTKIKDYGNEFIFGWVIACWQNILMAIAQNKDLPFN